MNYFKRSKVIGTIMIMLILLSSTTFANDLLSKLHIRDDALLVEKDIIQHNEEVSINLQDSINFNELVLLAEKNSTVLKIAKYDLENTKIQFNDAKDLKDLNPTDQVPYKDSMGNVYMVSNPDAKMQMEISKEIVYNQAKNSVELANKRVHMEKQNLYNQVISLLINYTKAEEGLTLSKANLERARNLMEMTNAQFEQGLIAKSQVLDSEVALSQAENGVKGAEVQYEIAKEDLLADIGIKDFEGLKIEPLYPESERIHISLEEISNILNFAYDHRIDYLMQKDNVTYEEKRLVIYKGRYGNLQDKIRSQEIVYEKEKLNLLEAKRNLRSQLYKTILGYNNAVNSLESLEKNVEKAKESLRIAELRYDAGLSTALEVISAQVNLQQAENQLLEGKYNIMSMKNNLESAMGGTFEEYLESLEVAQE